MARRPALVVLLVGLAASCASGNDGAAPAASDTTLASTTETSEAPTTTTTALGVTVAEGQPATATCPRVPPEAVPDPDRPSYTMRIRVLLDQNAVNGTLVVRFRPDLPTDRLVFRLWPNGPRLAGAGARLDVGPVGIDGRPPTAGEQPDPTTLVVPLSAELAAGDEVSASLAWRLTLPGPTSDRIARHGDAVRLGSFFPILAWEPGVGWALDPATSAFAEASTAPVADFSYEVIVPPGLTVLASGVEEGGRWRATAMRDVAVSVGRFTTAEATVAAPAPVRVVVGVHGGLDVDPGAFLDRVSRSLEDFSVRFGPYPYGSFSLAITPGLGGGIEYPGHVMQGPATLGRTTPHEVGHQWFYGLVGNDQGRDPWLDEGLASWAESRFEDTLGGFTARTLPSDAEGRVGEPMTFWEDRPSSYYGGVYVQGVQALAALGPPEQVDCALRLFVARQAFALATPGDLLEAILAVFPEAVATLARFGIAP